MLPSLRLTLLLCGAALFFLLAPLYPPLFLVGIVADCAIVTGRPSRRSRTAPPTL